jgi:hypothetical protein
MPISELSDDHDVWLTRLSDHLKEERYGSCARAYILRTKGFIGYLQDKALSVHAAQPSDVEKYLHPLRRQRTSRWHAGVSEGWRAANRTAIRRLYLSRYRPHTSTIRLSRF